MLFVCISIYTHQSDNLLHLKGIFTKEGFQCLSFLDEFTDDLYEKKWITVFFDFGI
jgi:hypothetical protein